MARVAARQSRNRHVPVLLHSRGRIAGFQEADISSKKAWTTRFAGNKKVGLFLLRVAKRASVLLRSDAACQAVGL